MANCLYNGVEFPDIESVWTDKETYPYAIILFGDRLILTSCRYYVDVENENWLTAESQTGKYIVYTFPWGYWQGGSANEFSNGCTLNVVGSTSINWSSYDVLSSDSYVYCEKGIIEEIIYPKYFYNGVLLPELPDILTNYPYCFIRKNTSSGYYDLIFGVAQWSVDAGHTLVECSSDSTKQWYRIEIATAETATEWTFNKESTSSFGIDANRPVMWSNHDILESDGSIYISASEPEKPKNPIYAKKLSIGEVYECGFDFYNTPTDSTLYGLKMSVELLEGEDVYVCMYRLPYDGPKDVIGVQAISENPFAVNFGTSGGKVNLTNKSLGSFRDISLTYYPNEKMGFNSGYYLCRNEYPIYLETLRDSSESAYLDYEKLVDSQYWSDSAQVRTKLNEALFANNMQVGETDNWLCNGTEVAPFPDTLTFKVLTDLNGEIALIASASPAEYVLNDSSGDTLVFNGAVACEAYMYDVTNVAWTSIGSASYSSLPCGNITWANYILNRKPTADSTETEEIPRDTMIDGVEYDGKDYFETPDTGGDSGGGTEPDNPSGGGTTETPNTNSAFMMGYMVGKALRLSR